MFRIRSEDSKIRSEEDRNGRKGQEDHASELRRKETLRGSGCARPVQGHPDLQACARYGHQTQEQKGEVTGEAAPLPVAGGGASLLPSTGRGRRGRRTPSREGPKRRPFRFSG